MWEAKLSYTTVNSVQTGNYDSGFGWLLIPRDKTPNLASLVPLVSWLLLNGQRFFIIKFSLLLYDVFVVIRSVGQTYFFRYFRIRKIPQLNVSRIK